MDKADVVGGVKQARTLIERRNMHLLKELAGHLEVRRKELSGEIKELIETCKKLQEQSRELRKQTIRYEGKSAA
jgi:hypothetical protein